MLFKLKIKPAFWIIPFTVYIITFGFAEITAWIGNCHGWWGTCWSRFDSGLYVEISEIGHTLSPCGIENGWPKESEKWCGNAGWAPFYPFLIFIFHLLSGVPSSICGILLSHFFFIAFLFVSSSIIQIESFKLSNWLALFLCSLCPGGIYFFSIFPISLVVLLISIIFWSISTQKYKYSFVPSFLLAVSYSSAIIVFFSFSIYTLYLFLSNRTNKNFRALWDEFKIQWQLPYSFRPVLINILIPGLLGLVSLYAYDWIVTGHWNAMYLVQNKYGHLIYSPFKHLGIHYNNLISHLNSNEALIDFHNIFFFFTMPILIYFFIKKNNSMTPLLIIFTLVMWYIPFCIGINVSLYRSIALLAPIMIFLHQIKNLNKLIILLVFGIFYYFMGVLFILSILH